MDRRAALRPAIIVGAVLEMLALFFMGRSGPIQGDWVMGLQLFLIFFVSAGSTWLFLTARKAPKGR